MLVRDDYWTAGTAAERLTYCFVGDSINLAFRAGVDFSVRVRPMTRVFETFAKDRIIVLPDDAPSPARCIVAILDQDVETLRREAASTIPEPVQQRMSDLLLKNREGQLSEQERAELDVLAREFDVATLAKGRALGLLAQLDRLPLPG